LSQTFNRGISKAEFDNIFENGIRVSGQFCRILVASGKARVGISTPKKIGCHARRNRLKRRLREAVKVNVNLLSNDLDTVILGKVDAESASFSEICADISQTLARANELWEKQSASI
jgi:ribonuclease P protein component